MIQWYNQRGEDSENRIKELKLDFGVDQLPCSDFYANARNFLIAALSYNLLTLLRGRHIYTVILALDVHNETDYFLGENN